MVALMNQKRIQFDSKLYKNSHFIRSFPGAIKMPISGMLYYRKNSCCFLFKFLLSLRIIQTLNFAVLNRSVINFVLSIFSYFENRNTFQSNLPLSILPFPLIKRPSLPVSRNLPSLPRNLWSATSRKRESCSVFLRDPNRITINDFYLLKGREAAGP